MSLIRIGLYTHNLTLRSLLSSVIGGEFKIGEERSAEEVRDLVLNRRCDVLVLDLDPDGTGIERQVRFYEEVASSPVPVIVIFDGQTAAIADALVRRGAYSSVRKPPMLRDLRTGLLRAYEHGRLKRELASARQDLEGALGCDGMIGASPHMRLVYDLVQRVANLEASVLITGESGTGKELVARAIHNLGGRAARPFVAVSCGAIPETLIEAELFGHEKGAFTGAAGAREGYLEQAGDGTLFLDEIGELSPHTQVKLLRVLQQREFSRLGSSRVIPLRARVLFATHRDLTAMIAQGEFRQDLYYRINVMRIACPSLEERTGDIPLLAHHFLKQYSQAYRKPVTAIEPRALALLQAYAWPGNVRELENAIQQAIILAEENTILPEDLPEPIREQELLELVGDSPAGSFERLLRDYKLKLARAAIQECHGNKTLAARSLCISRAYLHRLIRLSDEHCSAA